MGVRAAKPRKPCWPFVLNAGCEIARGLIGWWPMEPYGGLRSFDLSGKLRHATLANGAEWKPVTFAGSRAGAINFDGTNDAATFTNPFSGATSASWVFWLYENTSLGSSTRSFYNSGDYNIGSISMHMDGQVWSGASNPFGSGTGWGVTNLAWNFIGLTYNAGSTLMVKYSKGIVLASSSSSIPASLGTSATAGIGANFTVRPWGGMIGEMLLFNRALSAAEMWSLYDPATRWQLRYQSGVKVWSIPATAASSTQPPRTMHQFRMRGVA